MTKKMEKTLVWEAIKSLSKKEIKEFTQFLQSPFYNQRTDLMLLFNLISTSKVHISREQIFQKVFPNEDFDDQKLRLHLSYLFKVIEVFLIQKEQSDHELHNQILLLEAYRKRNLNRHFQKALNKTQKIFQQQNLRHPEFYFHNFLMESEQFQFLSGTGRTQEMNLQAVENNLNYTFISMKLRQACFTRSHESVFNTAYEISLLDEVLAIAAQPAYEKIPAIAVYFYCFKALFQSENENDFQVFKRKLFELTHHFPKEEIANLYILAINFCVRKINENKRPFLREALDFYQNGLEKEILLQNGQLSRFSFDNIASIAIRLGEFDWVERFINDYKDSLDIKFRESTFSLNSAKLEFTRKNHHRALQLLQKADYKDLINNMIAKVLQLKIYYELDEFDLLDSHLKTMKIFIRRNKKMGYHHKNWTNIVRFTQKLVDLNHFDKAAKKALAEEIQHEGVLTEKEWLLEQLNS
jgi:hypothetical protein